MRHALASLAVVMLLSGVAAADQFGCPTCRSCGGTCVLQARPVVDKETCYEVECKDVCIPAVRFPWDSCREPKCGGVRRIAVLKKQSRETKSCRYEWVIVCPRCGKPHQGGGSMPGIPPAPSMAIPPAPPATAGVPDAGFRLREPVPQQGDHPFRLVGAESERSSTR